MAVLARIALFAMIVGLVALFGRPAAAAAPVLGEVCLPKAQLLDILALRYHERPVGLGLTPIVPGGAHILIVARADGGTWSWVILWPDGTACLRGAGVNWRPRPAAPHSQPGQSKPGRPTGPDIMRKDNTRKEIGHDAR
jgi:hypothetical protein